MGRAFERQIGNSMAYTQVWLWQEETLFEVLFGSCSLEIVKKYLWPGQIVHALNPSTWELSGKDGEFEVSLNS